MYCVTVKYIWNYVLFVLTIYPAIHTNIHKFMYLYTSGFTPPIRLFFTTHYVEFSPNYVVSQYTVCSPKFIRFYYLVRLYNKTFNLFAPTAVNSNQRMDDSVVLFFVLFRRQKVNLSPTHEGCYCVEIQKSSTYIMTVH